MQERVKPSKPSADQLDAMATEVLTRTGNERQYRLLRQDARIARRAEMETQGEIGSTPIPSPEGSDSFTIQDVECL